jgi:CrcB protein
MNAYLLVGLGSMVGGLLRRGLAGIEGALAVRDVDLRWSTIVMNTLGSLVIGVLAGLPASVLPAEPRLFFGAGLCGGFTGLSAFSVETLTLLRQGDRALAVVNVLVSVVAGVGAAAAGYGVTLALVG